MTTPSRRRAGMTQVELLIALTLLGIVGGAVIGVLVRQQRITARTSALVDTRDHSRFTLATLAAELRGLSSIGGDIAMMTDTSMRIRTNVGTSVICAIGAGRTSFTIPPTALVQPPSSGVAVVLTSFVDRISPPTANDTAWVLNPDIPSQAPWDSVRVVSPGVTAVNPAVGCPRGGTTSFLPAGASEESFTVPVASALPAGVTVGSPVRFTRTVRYTFYRDATDGQWYLGFQNCAGAGGCGTAQPMSGPFLPPTASANTTGFRFTYYDSLGAVTNVPRDVARIQITTRASSREAVSAGSGTRSQFVQTDSISVALRNRS